MKRKKLLKWEDGTLNSKVAIGDKMLFGYIKEKEHYSLGIKDGNIAIGLKCKTERHCLMISNILNQV